MSAPQVLGPDLFQKEINKRGVVDFYLFPSVGGDGSRAVPATDPGVVLLWHDDRDFLVSARIDELCEYLRSVHQKGVDLAMGG